MDNDESNVNNSEEHISEMLIMEVKIIESDEDIHNYLD